MEISGAFVSANKHILAGPAIMRYSQGLQVEIDPGTGAVELLDRSNSRCFGLLSAEGYGFIRDFAIEVCSSTWLSFESFCTTAGGSGKVTWGLCFDEDHANFRSTER